MDKEYVLEIRTLEGDTVIHMTKPDTESKTIKLEQAYDRKIDHTEYYTIVVEV
jgi:hypothetical protein